MAGQETSNSDGCTWNAPAEAIDCSTLTFQRKELERLDAAIASSKATTKQLTTERRVVLRAIKSLSK